jgi:hypothetical protein
MSCTEIIPCAAVIEEMLSLLPPGVEHQELDFDLRMNPESLIYALQNAVDVSIPLAKIVLLVKRKTRAPINIR